MRFETAATVHGGRHQQVRLSSVFQQETQLKRLEIYFMCLWIEFPLFFFGLSATFVPE
jgi:hypothetical protein